VLPRMPKPDKAQTELAGRKQGTHLLHLERSGGPVWKPARNDENRPEAKAWTAPWRRSWQAAAKLVEQQHLGVLLALQRLHLKRRRRCARHRWN
jgi:hypothetical protein